MNLFVKMIKEKIFYLLLRLRSMSGKRFVIQTRDVSKKLFENAVRGNLIDFYRDEILERKRFSYPPFKKLIKITREGGQNEVKKDMEFLREKLAAYDPIIFPAFVARSKGKERVHALLKIEPERWPDTKLVLALRSLPPSFLVDVEPEMIL